jgi:predicted AAA+ superfamily ATPase
MVRLHVPIQPKTYEYGDSFEHFVLLEIQRLSEYRECDLKLSYYRTSNQAEVDIIVA